MKTSNQSRRYLAFLSLRPSLGLALTLLGVLLLIWASPTSTAREKITTNQGIATCCLWCDKHNKTEKSRKACYDGCFKYWLKNGSDAPSNAVGPNPTATPRQLPIEGPPRRLGLSPTPSATAKPILLDKPKPTPSPKPTPKKDSHGHH